VKDGCKVVFFLLTARNGARQQVKYSSIEALHEPAGTLRWEERHYRIWTGMHNHGGTGGWVVGWLGEEGKGGRTYILVAVLLLSRNFSLIVACCLKHPMQAGFAGTRVAVLKW